MDKAEVAALQEYEDALTEFLTSVWAREGRSDLPFMAALIQKSRRRLRMLSVGPLASHFSPSQDIRVIKSASDRMVMYITDKFP
jgi:hypothetical protein